MTGSPGKEMLNPNALPEILHGHRGLCGGCHRLRHIQGFPRSLSFLRDGRSYISGLPSYLLPAVGPPDKMVCLVVPKLPLFAVIYGGDWRGTNFVKKYYLKNRLFAPNSLKILTELSPVFYRNFSVF